ncbi:Small-conductance mechanosensitive channel [Frankia canadensis]|uniref:Small-conductance mechanosensitive channel n=1 Tax=Frankia canadensis TaxID=1836972 RepID=A0A2I2KVJ0_9ACTN|nr:mechanosensitive ion channel family protein [Frankia canadensis]SNQ49687.1 Small-conductance mechanosensitive channel [Frankia canadensis]SOU56977.1 Small-conductance mechanosensitive channel [Frankia canadensis]
MTVVVTPAPSLLAEPLIPGLGMLLSASPAPDAQPGSAAAVVSGTPLPSPSPSASTDPLVSLEGVANALRDACGTSPGLLCRTVYNATHSNYLASGAEVFLGTPIRILLILVIAFVVRALLHRFIRRTAERAGAGGNGGFFRSSRAGTLLGAFGDPAGLMERRRQRAATVGSLLRSVTSIFVFGLAFLSVLGELGINLAPIVASAGVLGIAVGFGAQNLVRDFLSGMFMLLEDQYGVGDVIDVGPVSGTVEGVSLRMTRLRDVEGTVWYVRNGEITRIGNKSQQWARAVLDVPLDYDTEVDAAKRVLARAADDLWADAEWSSLILSAPEVWGMETMTADGYTLRVAIKTQPLKQWEVARELRERVRNALSDAGIALGSVQRSEVTVVDDEEEEGGTRAGEDDDDNGIGAPALPAGGGGGSIVITEDVPRPRIDPPSATRS